MSPLYMLFAIPAFFLLMGAEYLYGRRKKKELYRLNDTVTNLNIGVGSQAFGLVSKVILMGVYVVFQENFGLFALPANVWTFIACLVLFDFLFYWAHRWGHTINIFWGAHGVHHQSEEYNLSVALRQSWFHNLLAFFIFLPIPVLGFPKEAFIPAAAAHTLYQFWIHTKTVDKLPKWIEFWLNTPSHHRVHHGINPKYIDKNHGGVFILWDRLFGTFQEEEEEPTYGITTQLKSWNPTWANFHYYVEMFQAMRKMSRWQDKLRMLVAKPGWRPEEMGGMQEVPEVNEETHQKYDKKSGPKLHFYVLVQFAGIIAGLMAYLHHFDTISTFYQWFFLIIMVLSLMICGGIFENKKWVVYAEYARLGVIALALNSYYYYWHPDWMTVMGIASAAGGAVMLGLFTYVWLTRQARVA